MLACDFKVGFSKHTVFNTFSRKPLHYFFLSASPKHTPLLPNPICSLLWNPRILNAAHGNILWIFRTSLWIFRIYIECNSLDDLFSFSL